MTQAEEIAQLRRELLDARRAMWCLVHAAGGEATIHVTDMAKAMAPGARITMGPVLTDPLRYHLKAETVSRPIRAITSENPRKEPHG